MTTQNNPSIEYREGPPSPEELQEAPIPTVWKAPDGTIVVKMRNKDTGKIVVVTATK